MDFYTPIFKRKSFHLFKENGDLFHFHENPNDDCPVGRNIHRILDDKLRQVQEAMEKGLASMTLEDLKRDMEKYIGQECPNTAK